jgi:phytoene/squalene synthetase
MSLVKRFDYVHYAAGLALPVERDAYYAVRALNVELATVRDGSGHHEARGRIRMQWWRELVEQVYRKDGGGDGGTAGGGSGRDAAAQLAHPVAIALSAAAPRLRLTKRWMIRALDAREADLAAGAYPYRTVEDLEVRAAA